MMLNEKDLRRIEAAVFELTGHEMARGGTEWPEKIAEALEIGTAAKRKLQALETLLASFKDFRTAMGG